MSHDIYVIGQNETSKQDHLLKLIKVGDLKYPQNHLSDSQTERENHDIYQITHFNPDKSDIEILV